MVSLETVVSAEKHRRYRFAFAPHHYEAPPYYKVLLTNIRRAPCHVAKDVNVCTLCVTNEADEHEIESQKLAISCRFALLLYRSRHTKPRPGCRVRNETLENALGKDERTCDEQLTDDISPVYS